VQRYDDIDIKVLAGVPIGPPVIIVSGIPTANAGWHAWKSLQLNPHDGKFYVAVGSPCNFCLEATGPGNPVTKTHVPWGTIISFAADGSDLHYHARGLRNSLGYDWDSKGNLWWTDNGRDNWDNVHYDKPWDELNMIPVDAKSAAPNGGAMPDVPNFGFPFCYGTGNNLATGGNDPQFRNKTCDPAKQDEYIGATLELGPHVAALGAKFVPKGFWPAATGTNGNLLIGTLRACTLLLFSCAGKFDFLVCIRAHFARYLFSLSCTFFFLSCFEAVICQFCKA
jgi:glucose/arabinose dehydrogenase